jgi:phosphonopyruvate decarboxylase
VIRAGTFIEQIRAAGFGLCSGVPCSYLTPLIHAVIDSQQIRYAGAANEGEAIAVCCGAELGGTRGLAMLQNSGLGNAVSPLTSLTETFQIPVLAIVTWRGEPGGPADEPQHTLMGQITPALLDLMGIAWQYFPETDEEVRRAVETACRHMDRCRKPYALIMRKGAVGNHPLPTKPDAPRPAQPSAGCNGSPRARLDQDAVLRAVQNAVAPTDAVLATTGFTGRALYALADRPSQFYMVGSMGCVSSLGLGLALTRPDRRVVVLDGDGAALMRMGAMAAVGCQQPRNLVHVLLDNAVHDSTGGQATLSRSVDFPGVARACGYRRVLHVKNPGQLAVALENAGQELAFLYVQTCPREDRKLPRPAIAPPQVAGRFREWLKNT